MREFKESIKGVLEEISYISAAFAIATIIGASFVCTVLFVGGLF